MEKRLDDQKREIKDIIRRAKGNPDRTGSLRRETLQRLIELTHSRHSSLKIIAAGDIKHFFRDFPDLEEAAINAIYDLCEDQDSEVRMAGYSAITQVSKERPNWVKRNADVLVQLLQSDEPDEVIVVKKALVEHLDMDCCVTLGVLCDQIVPPDDLADEEEQFIRDRLRSLVLSFITMEAKRAIVERHASQLDSGAEEVLVNALWMSIPKLSNKDMAIVVKDILVLLPSYKTPHSPRGIELLRQLLDKANASFRTDFRPGDRASFENTRFHLGLANFIVLKEHVCSPVNLLQFYCTHLIGKMTLAKLAPDDAASIISDTAEILSACDDQSREGPHVGLVPLRRQVVDACPILLERLVDSRMAHMRSWRACKALLRACLQRKQESKWTVPTPLANLLRNISVLPQSPNEKGDFQDVQNLIRSLVQLPIKLGSHQSPTQATNILSDPVRSIHSNARSSLPARPSSLSQDFDLRRRLTLNDTKAEPAFHTTGGHSASTSTSSKRSTVTDGSPRPSKKVKQGDGGGTDSGPSLLSRMGSSVSNGPRDHTTSRQGRGASQGTNQVDLNLSEDEKSPAGGFSILGAAKAQRSTESSQLPVSSLLDRIRDLTPDDDDWARKKRRRGKVHR